MRTPGAGGLRLFGVEDRAAQLTWSALGPGSLEVEVDGATHTRHTTGGPGALTISGLEPDRAHTAVVSGDGLPRAGVTLALRTLPSPPGRELFRFATLSDLHIGTDHFDFRHRVMTEEPGVEPHPTRCARAAIDELTAWGAQRLVLKGDLTERSRPHEWDTIGELVARVRVPVDAIPGNHDVKRRLGWVPPVEGARRAALHLADDVEVRDLPGLRLVLAPTTVPGHSRGRIDPARRRAVVDALGQRGTPAVVILHHYLQVLPFPWFWPPGVPRGQATRFLREVAAANPRALLTSGHTHRHRRREFGPLVLTEVGSPKDYPGTWAGYVVHEGGIRQVVRRVESDDCLSWLERTRRAVYGTWGLWSPGPRSSRCFTHPWP